jgi:putative transferase (TIGR04331 family)
MNNNLTKGFMGFFLITTEEESTWEFDLPILFIGSHCLNYDRKNTWEKLNYQLNPPLCKGQEEKNQALQITRKQVNELLSELTIKMNLIHGVNHRERYWNIFIGYWVRLFVDVLYNRYFTIELALSNFEINKTIFFKNENELVASDSTEFINLCNDNVWNNILYSKILKFREVSLEFEEIASFQTTDFQGILSSSTKKFSIKKFLINLYSKISPLLCRDSDAFIIESYLPGIDELKLQLALGQWPQVWNIPRPTKTSIDHKIRAQLKFDLQNRTGFEKFIRMLLPEMIPTCYLEGYGNLLRQISELPYPKYPKFIFTSNCFERYEVFNLWTAEKTEKNIKYFIGQHGNNYGTHFSSGPEICAKEKSADKFFSWGWEAPEFNVVSAFNFKITNRSPRSYNPRGGLILVEVCYFPYLSAWDVSYDYSLYQEEIFKFVELLSPNIHEKLIVRLHGA